MAPPYNIPLIKPYLPPGTKEAVGDVLDSGYLTEGPVTREFEAAFAAFVGVHHAIAMTSCTTGLEVALRAVGVGPGDEVIAPDYTFPATADVIALVGADIVLVDIDPATMLVDYDWLEAAVTPRTKAIMPVSQFGNPLDYNRLAAIAGAHGLAVIEDAACALGGEFGERKVGTHADIAVFSLHPRKFVTTGEGGIVVTANPEWADWMRSFKHFGASSRESRVDTCFARVGTNYKLSNILAAVGLVQMRHVEELRTRRLDLARRYEELVTGAPGVALPVTTPGGVHSQQTFCVLIADRDRVMGELRTLGIEVQIGSYALHTHPAFAPGPHVRHHGPFPGSLSAFARCLALPLYHEMTDADQEAVVRELRTAVRG